MKYYEILEERNRNFRNYLARLGSTSSKQEIENIMIEYKKAMEEKHAPIRYYEGKQ